MTQSHVHFIVVENDPFIARDMSEGLRSADPSCSVHILRTPGELVQSEDVLRTMAERSRLAVITKLPVREIDRLGFQGIAGSAPVTIVVREGEDQVNQVLSRGWLSLPTPFTGDDLADLTGHLRETR